MLLLNHPANATADTNSNATPLLTDTHFDVIVLGTGFHESFMAATLARRGEKVLHLDTASTYGGASRAYTLQELDHENALDPSDPVFSITTPFTPESSESAATYHLDLSPKTLYARGPLVAFLGETGVGRHLDFKPMDHLFVQSPEMGGGPVRVPMSKEDVFNAPLDLPSRRRLMQFFKHVMGTGREEGTLGEYMGAFNLPPSLRSMIVHGVAMVSSEEVPASHGTSALRLSLTSLGRFGATNRIVPMHAGGTELCQALCRVCAVYGGTYVLRARVAAVRPAPASAGWSVDAATTGATDAPATTYTCARLVAGPAFRTLVGAEVTVVGPHGARSVAMCLLLTTEPLRALPAACAVLTGPHVRWLQQTGIGIGPGYVVHGTADTLARLKAAVAQVFPDPGAIFNSMYYLHTVEDVASTSPTLLLTPSPTSSLDYDDDFVAFTRMASAFLNEPFHFEPLPDPEKEC